MFQPINNLIREDKPQYLKVEKKFKIPTYDVLKKQDRTDLIHIIECIKFDLITEQKRMGLLKEEIVKLRKGK
jgi:hypothetical protein